MSSALFTHTSHEVWPFFFFVQVAKQFGGGAGQDMTAFPDIKFVEPKVDDINLTSAS